MSSYVKPQVLVFQEFTIVPTEITEPLRAHIAGPHAVLHRYKVSDEKDLSGLGVYDRLSDTCYPWPGRTAGSRIDDKYTKLFVDDALLLYYQHDVGSPSNHNVTPVAGKTNWIKSNVLSFKTNGTYSRSAVFNDRDVQVGDVVQLRSVLDNEGTCIEKELTTYVTGFASDTVPSRIAPARSDTNNQVTTTANVTIAPIGSAVTCLTVAASVNNVYDGRPSGDVAEEYIVEVIKSSVAGCNATKLRVTSASGRDDQAEIEPSDFGDDTSIGTRGLKVVFDVNTDPDAPCADAGAVAGVVVDQFVVGLKWRISVRQAFPAVAAAIVAGGFTVGPDSNVVGRYTGEQDDVYVVECTRGGKWADLPEITVRTVKGLDFSAPIAVTATTYDDDVLTIGNNNVKINFVGVAEGAITGLRKGDKWYVPVTASKAGAVTKLILRHDLPQAMAAAEELDLKLFIKDDIQVAKQRTESAPLTNYYTEDTQICVQEGMTAFHPDWTDGGAPLPLPVYSGALYVEYREWLSTLADQVNAISTTSDLDLIAGQLDPDNPLKWGVYKALSNANGTVVKYTAVANPDSLDSWAEVLDRLRGRDDIYNLVPLTFDRLVQNLWAAQTVSESNSTANNWKAAFVSVKSRPSVAVVGDGVAIAGVSGSTIDGPVLAVLEDDPAATGTQYTRLRVPTGSGYFITNNVRPGDLVRYMYTTDGFGEESYEEFVVDEVLSENSLRLYSGGSAPVTEPQRVEIYHNNNRNEIADDIATQAGAFSSRRVCAVWPDQVGEGGVMQPGYYLAAALGGLASGVAPQQPLTNVEVAGFDDYSRSYKYFNETQLNRMAEAGVWIVTEDRDGTPYTRHALTTDNLGLNQREEMIRRNVDSMSYLFLRRLRPYIGRTNATEGMVQLLRNQITATIDTLRTNGNTVEIGSQLISGSIRTLRIHPLLRDRIEIVLDLVVPAPLNNIELHLVV